MMDILIFRLQVVFIYGLVNAFAQSTVQINCTIAKLDDEAFSMCGSKGYAMRCNNTNMESIPKEYPKTRNLTEFTPPLCLLNLSSNAFNSIENGSFVNATNLNSTAVLWLYLDFCNLTYIASNAFENLTNLLYLNLSGNLLNKPDSFGTGVFIPLSRLKYVNIKENKFETFEVIGRELKVLKELESIFVDLCSDCVFGPDFKDLHTLTKISLSGRSTNACNVGVVRNNTFVNVPGIRQLWMASCHINDIEANAFSPLKVLSLLDISYNENLTFTGMNKALYGLRNSTTLTVLNVNRIHTPYETGIQLKLSDIEYLKTLSVLETLHMDLNKIEVFEEDILKPFQLPQTLKDFTLSGNRLTYGRYTHLLHEATNVTQLDISRQHLNYDPFFHRHYEDRETTDYSGFENINGLIKRGNDSCYPFCIACLPRNLRKVLWRQSFIFLKIENPVNICHAEGLTHLDLSFNLILKWNSFVYGLENLIHLDLSENYCNEVNHAFFVQFPSLRHLNISGNALGHSFNPTINTNASKMFELQRDLETLDISGNKIKFLPSDIFQNLTKLQYLNLSSNLIVDWNYSLANSRCLSELDLSGNKLYNLPESLTSYLDSLLEEGCNKTVRVTLHSNPLECTCKTLSFLKWMRTSKVSVNLYATDVCRLNGESYSLLTEDHLAYIIDILEHDMCVDRTWVTWTISSICSLLTCFMSVIICFLVYRNRWKLRYIYYSRNRRYKHEGFEHLFENDAFIAYAENNASFIKNQVVPSLEGQHGLRLWVADRNSMPGSSIAENISHAIYNCRKSVLLIDNSYLSDTWCDYEINMAHVESVETKRNLIIIVLMESVQMNKLPICLLKSLRSGECCIEWPEDEHDIDTFWMKLADEINS